MCGRFTLSTPASVLADTFLFPEMASQPARYNIAPTQNVAAVRLREESAARELALLHWGLIPFWAEDPKIGNRMINARAETVSEKPAFRTAFRRRRCLILTDGFYEWKRAETHKQPYFFHMRDRKPFAFGGLWEHWDKQGKAIDSCSIITTQANELMAQVHDRMPVIVGPEDYQRWLDPNETTPDVLKPLLRPYPAELMTDYLVSTLVNNPRNDQPKCVEPIVI